MAESVAFGRRTTPPVRKPPHPKDAGLSPQAEAFRARLGEGEPPGEDFAAWRRSQAGRTATAWLLGLALLFPGVVCFALDAPTPLAILVEAAGIGGNWWLRRERRRRLKAIANWEPAS